MYVAKGRQREMGLGPFRDVPLARARELAAAARRLLADGRDPLAEREKTDKPKPTFGECADAYIEAMRPEWKSAKHAWQWEHTLKVYAAPLRSRPVDEIDTAAVLEVLRPLWTKIPETASRLRGRIESVLDAAKVRGERAGENPSRWRGHLEELLPGRRRLSRGHQKALPYTDVPALMDRLRANPSLSARAVEFTILTAARTGEAIGARCEEFDLDGRVWTVPAVRMKMRKAHRVPLSASALHIVTRLLELRTSDFVFPGIRPGSSLSNMAMLQLVRGMRLDVTVHGFRSSFRDWCGETTLFPREVAEAALAHKVGDAVEQAYRRGDALEKRRQLMESWSQFCGGKPAANVVGLKAGGAS